MAKRSVAEAVTHKHSEIIDIGWWRKIGGNSRLGGRHTEWQGSRKEQAK